MDKFDPTSLPDVPDIPASIIESGIADGCLVGGTEAPLSPVTFAALTRTNELATNEDPAAACRPFDCAHAGMVLSEASAFLMLEPLEHARARGATVYASVLGGTFSCDAQGMYGADPTGAAAAKAIRRLLTATGTGPSELDYICAHANSSPLFDRKEITVLSAALGEFLPGIPISSIKGVIGHPFGASGALQAAAAALAIRDGVIPPTANLESPDTECRAHHVIGAALERVLRRVLITSYGYGGVNGYLLVAAPEA
jgi:3-oxoacyl-(acyl-carrier-protein) synthase